LAEDLGAAPARDDGSSVDIFWILFLGAGSQRTAGLLRLREQTLIGL
jgi:hypothetical protein